MMVERTVIFVGDDLSQARTRKIERASEREGEC